MQKIIKCSNFIIYWSIVSIPFSIAIAPGVVNTFLAFMVAGFLLKKILKRERLFINTPLNLPFVFFILFAILSFINSVDYRTSFHGMEKIIRNAVIFLVCAEEIKNREHVKKIIISIILGVFLVSIDAIWQFIFGWDFIQGNVIQSSPIHLARPTASFPNPNIMGIYLTAITPIIIGLTLFYYQGRTKIVMFFISALAVTGIFLTLSRGSGLGLYLGVLFLSLVRKKKIISVILVAILLIFPFVMPKNIKNWAKEINYNPLVFIFNYDRLSMFRNTLNMIKHHPLIGVGVNTFSKNYAKYKLPESDNARTQDTTYTHNIFLQMAGEIGLLGLGAFIWFLFRLFKQAMHVYRNFKDEYSKIISLSVVACLIAFLINGLTETSLYYSRVAMIFWYLVGFSLSLKEFISAY